MFSKSNKNNNKGLSLRALYIWVIALALVVSGLMFYSTFRLTKTFRRLTEATEDQISMEKASYELMDASDYLTECAQRFTVDGDIEFLNNYFTEAFETKRREDAINKMSTDQDVSAALEELQQAMDDSVKLMDREYYSMRLVIEAKGYTDYPEQLDDVKLSTADSALSAEEKMMRATEMVLDDDYYEQKNRIRSKMRQSLYVLESLTRNTQSEAFADVRSMTNNLRIIIILQILMMIIVVVLTVRLGITPILEAVDRIKSDRPIREGGANEFRYLARAYNDLTVKLSQENELLKDMSQTDALTGVKNRMALRNDYDSYKGHEVTVMMLDLDGFKMINDSCGHEEGDRVLRETGKLLSDAFEKQFCYRYGGDEFLIICPDISEEEFSEKLKLVVGNRPKINFNGSDQQVGYSVGCVHSVVDRGRRLHDLFAEADEKMYMVKRGERDFGKFF